MSNHHEYNRIETEQKVLEVLTQSIKYQLDPMLLNNTDIVAYAGKGISAKLEASVTFRCPAEKFMDIRYESSGWQLFKKKYFSKKLLDRFPVKYSSYCGYFLHPEIKTRGDENKIYYAVHKIVEDNK